MEGNASSITPAEAESLAALSAGLAESAAAYIDAHPELQKIVQDFLRAALSERPKDPLAFARVYFGSPTSPPAEDESSGSTGGDVAAPQPSTAAGAVAPPPAPTADQNR